MLLGIQTAQLARRPSGPCASGDFMRHFTWLGSWVLASKSFREYVKYTCVGTDVILSDLATIQH